MNFGENFQSLEVFENETFDPPDHLGSSDGPSVGMTTFGENLTENVNHSLRYWSDYPQIIFQTNRISGKGPNDQFKDKFWLAKGWTAKKTTGPLVLPMIYRTWKLIKIWSKMRLFMKNMANLFAKPNLIFLISLARDSRNLRRVSFKMVRISHWRDMDES